MEDANQYWIGSSSTDDVDYELHLATKKFTIDDESDADSGALNCSPPSSSSSSSSIIPPNTSSFPPYLPPHYPYSNVQHPNETPALASLPLPSNAAFSNQLNSFGSSPFSSNYSCSSEDHTSNSSSGLISYSNGQPFYCPSSRLSVSLSPGPTSSGTNPTPYMAGREGDLGINQQAPQQILSEPILPTAQTVIEQSVGTPNYSRRRARSNKKPRVKTGSGVRRIGKAKLIPGFRPHSTPATLIWLQKNYEMADGICIPRSTLYKHYVDFCDCNKILPVNAASFGKVRINDCCSLPSTLMMIMFCFMFTDNPTTVSVFDHSATGDSRTIQVSHGRSFVLQATDVRFRSNSSGHFGQL
jgi:hypothetical protein